MLIRLLSSRSRPTRRFSSINRTNGKGEKTSPDHIDIRELLSKPTWSVASLLPAKNNLSEGPEISSKQIRHLLRLSALPPPKNADEEGKMLATLSSQLHFVREVQRADTTGVHPLRGIRDETKAGEKNAELGMNALQEALDAEESLGKHYRRIRRRRHIPAEKNEEEWDPLATANKKIGHHFVVDGGKSA